MSFPPMQPASDATSSRPHAYYDGRSSTLMISERERPYPQGRLIVSRTNLDGIITHCNEAFLEISGYTRDELIGQPHCILRHPDIPRAIYKDLWDTLRAGKKWFGYVKNLCKDGSHYWVYATAVPNLRGGKVIGYSSVRREPSRRKIQEAVTRYQAMCAAEEAGS